MLVIIITPQKMKRILRGGRISIQTKIILPYLVLVFLLLAAATYIGTQILFDSIQERFTNQLIEAGKLSTNEMVRQENGMLETMRLLANMQGVSEAMQLGDADQLRLLALPVAVNVRQDAILFVNIKGTSILSMVHNPQGDIQDYSYTSGSSEMQSWGFVQSVMRGENDARGDKFAGFVQASFGNYFFIAGPVRDQDGKLAGILLIGQTTKSLVDAMREATLAQVTLYAPDGKVIATTFTDAPELDSSTARQVMDSQDKSSLIRDLTRSDINYREILGAWRARGNDIGVLGTAFAKNFFVRFSEQRLLLILTSTVTALLLVIAVGVFISKNISEPIQKLERAASRVSKGDLDVHVQPNGKDEIAELTREFNSMVESLYQSRRDIIAAYDSTIEAWAKTLEMYDNETLGHSQRVTELTLKLARSFGISGDELEQVRRGALLHDIGKLTIPINILRKPGPLTPGEEEMMRNHPVAAYEMLKNISFLSRSLDIPYCHHERWDGTGYPRGLKGNEIPLTARLFAVVDVWDALRSDRPYRKGISHPDAAEELNKGRNTLFDPDAVDALLKMV